MAIFLIIIGILGLILIYHRVVKRVRKEERVKVSPELMQGNDTPNSQAVKATTSFKKAMSWKRKTIDYKQLNQTYNNADYHYSRGEFAEAERGFIKVIALKEDHPEANNKLGIIYMKQNQHKKAEAIYRFLTEVYPQRPLYYSNLGRALYNQKNLPEAATAYERSVQLDKTRRERFLSLGQVYREMNDFKNAVKAFSKALELDLRNEELYFLIADLLEQLSAFDEAVAYMEAMLDQFPYNEIAKSRIRDYRRRAKISPLSTEQGKSKAGKDNQSKEPEANDTEALVVKASEPIVSSPEELQINNLAFEEGEE